MQERRIFHADFNCFYASVACCQQPELKAYPVAVAGDPEQRHGIILAKNEHAKRFGVKTGEAIWQAKQKCPKLVLVKPDYPAYLDFSRRGRQIYEEYSDRVEGFGLDENWIDVSGATADFREAEVLAQSLRSRIREELGITVSIGVAGNKVFAKLGSDLRKPDAVSLVSPENYRQTAWPLPARDLLYVGRATETKLRKYGILTIGDIARTPPAFLKAQLGKMGVMLHAFANGMDVSPVMFSYAENPVKSIGNGVTTPRDLVNEEDVYLTVMMLSESVASRLRENGMRARTVSIAIRDTGLYTFSRQVRLEKPSDITDEIIRAAMGLFRANYLWTAPVRALTVTAMDLIGSDTPTQLSLFSDETHRLKAEALDRAVDGIRSRFGYGSIGRALYLKDEAIGNMHPMEDHLVHPVGYLAGEKMLDVVETDEHKTRR